VAPLAPASGGQAEPFLEGRALAQAATGGGLFQMPASEKKKAAGLGAACGFLLIILGVDLSAPQTDPAGNNNTKNNKNRSDGSCAASWTVFLND
jgi:hypothetical protein